ncbi:hypothetical protein HN832_02315 [archaeon]|jgi:mRNA-degrading endonuclease RelE of RelBE toxin-antitoxin system|nr:hypothetical protein [archaeon]MBT4373188.1 hypothetical protein [archaeon]MBT4531533.1 hypothetical protein [archaeon]MBT7001289.1 hypothetical protein [archaeon]MBT7282225.1 hypothetical protein [archaeon]
MESGEKPKIKYVNEFEKDIHKLKKYRSIVSDVEVFIKALLGYFPNLEHSTFHVKKLTDFGEGFHFIYKARKVRCKYLKSTRDLRIIYTYNPYENKIILIAIYAKNKQANHDVNRIKPYLVKKINN